ncbi:MAG: valine--tRNA ligase [Firmicutes bacterium]|nr:valine--tRNA ligase [Bacillota bacterium]
MQVRLPPVYDPRAVEEERYRFWMEGRYFGARVNRAREPFCIVIPPPNVTGSLHIGHALDNTMQDILIRWRRMQGYETLWLPGTDHAGIATQHVVEKRLAKDGLSRHDLGREKFLERVWAWKDEYEATIISQLRRLGASCDWSRTRFTMDEGCSRAVREVFVRLWEKGLIYRGEYIVNWCPECRTALSDLEVEREERAGTLWYVRYPYADGSGYLTVATTRPETILGDTAVAVHPDDERYRDAVGKTVVVPMVDRPVPVVADRAVDPAFGTGAVKITPAHDADDFEVACRHGLPAIAVIDADGNMTEEAGRYAGMTREECRRAILDDLRAAGLIEKEETHAMALGHCYRCDTVVEPLLSRQWFVRMKPLAEPAMEAVKTGDIVIVPERFTRVYVNWLENIRDWCISRQIWWGHRIPAWHCHRCGEITVSRTDPPACAHCGSERLEQDESVLDTWFSSALWPFSTLGWPERTPELEYFYPTSVLVTGYDILFFWVARMVFMGLEFMGKKPFRYVLLHGLVRDAEGEKMSKSRGTGIDPMDAIEKYGADSLRFSLIMGNTPGNDFRFYWEKVEGARNFCNKLWNAARFVLMNLEDFDPEARAPLALVDRWILSRYARVRDEVTRLLEEFELGEAARILYDFIWDEYCDWYIEMSKARLAEGGPARLAAQRTLWLVLEGVLRLLHPFVPFITEEIWQRLPHEGPALAVAPWPGSRPDLVDRAAEEQVGLWMEVTRAIRNLRAEVGVGPGQPATAVALADPETVRALAAGRDVISRLSWSEPLRVARADEDRPSRAVASVVRGVEVFLPLEGVVDVAREVERTTARIREAEAELQRVEERLKNSRFLERAPREVVEEMQSRRQEALDRVRKLKERLQLLQQ